MMYSDTTSTTSTTDTVVYLRWSSDSYDTTDTVVYLRWSSDSYDTTPAGWAPVPQVVVVRPSWYSVEHAPVKKFTDKMLRDMAAAAAHQRFIAESVRAPAPIPPPEQHARHGFYQGPRLSCHSSTRSR